MHHGIQDGDPAQLIPAYRGGRQWDPAPTRTYQEIKGHDPPLHPIPPRPLDQRMIDRYYPNHPCARLPRQVAAYGHGRRLCGATPPVHMRNPPPRGRRGTHEAPLPPQRGRDGQRRRHSTLPTSPTSLHMRDQDQGMNVVAEPGYLLGGSGGNRKTAAKAKSRRAELPFPPSEDDLAETIYGSKARLLDRGVPFGFPIHEEGGNGDEEEEEEKREGGRTVRGTSDDGGRIERWISAVEVGGSIIGEERRAERSRFVGDVIDADQDDENNEEEEEEGTANARSDEDGGIERWIRNVEGSRANEGSEANEGNIGRGGSRAATHGAGRAERSIDEESIANGSRAGRASAATGSRAVGSSYGGTTVAVSKAERVRAPSVEDLPRWGREDHFGAGAR